MAHFVRTAVLITLLMGLVYTMCPNNCISCQGNKCSICDEKYYLAGESCHLCPENCLSCVHNSSCNTCKSHKWGNGFLVCINDCDKQCADSECHDDTGYCVKCEPGKFGRKCQYSCDLCRNEMCDLYKCVDGCKSGYYAYETESDYICQQCPNNCDECFDGKICRRCNDGFYLHQFSLSNNVYVHCYRCQTGKDCSRYCSIYGCNHCQLNNNKLLCADCPKGEIFNGTTCVQNTTFCSYGCSTNCDINGVCLGNCTNGWSGDKCLNKCNDNCAQCSQSDRNKCLRCKGDFYLSDCSSNCSDSCVSSEGSQTCSTNEGHCMIGCQQGFWGKKCDESCSAGCLNTTCDRNNGSCLGKCKDGFIGDLCTPPSTLETTLSSTESDSRLTTDENKQNQNQENKSNDIVIIGAASGGGGLVLILVCVLCLCLLKKRRKSKDESVQHETITIEDQNLYAKPMKKAKITQESQDYIYAQPDKSHKQRKPSKREISAPKNTYDNVAIALDDGNEDSHNMHRNITIDASEDIKVETEETNIDDIELEELDEGSSEFIDKDVKPPSADLYYNTASLIRSRIQISDLLEYNRKKTDYESEFEKLPKGLTRPCDVALMRNNRLKNRYNGVYAYDATRVVLQSQTYINANYIDGQNKSHEYVASLGPTKTAMNDFKDFWEMVFQEKVDKIIMLTNLEESGKMKCEKYWPNQGKAESYHGYKVICIAETIYSEFTIREFTISVKGSKPRKVTQYHYTAWPDRSVPDNVASLVEFRHKVDQAKTKDDGPMIVHCSAGIGRTGTYIALDTLIQEGKEENYIDIFGRVMALRAQRGHMIQNLEQYIFLHQCLLYALTCDPDPLPVAEIPRIMTDDKISEQFQKLSDVIIPQAFDRKSSANTKVRKENRKGADIPGDQYRVRLCSTKHDFINAVYVNGYRNQNKFIVAQTPLPSTVEDFISMIYHEKSTCIVDLDDENIKDKSLGHYLPQHGKVFKVGHFQVACKKFDTSEHVTIRQLSISRNGPNLAHELHLKHYHLKGWSHSEKVPSKIEPLLKLVKDTENDFNGHKEDRPIVVHCLTGAERSCLFCAVSIISEKCSFEKEISVLNTICQLRSRRKTAFCDVRQFKFCYQSVSNMSKNSDKKQYYNMAQLL